jgi:hypothetical protein
MSSISLDTLSTIFAFIPLEKRGEFGQVSCDFAQAIKQSHVSENDKVRFGKTRRAAFFERHLDKVKWIHISMNELLPTEFFRKHVDKVDWYYLSGNPAIPVELLEKHLGELNWSSLSANKSVPLEFFENHSSCNEIRWCRVFRNYEFAAEDYEFMLNNYSHRGMIIHDLAPLERLDRTKVDWTHIFSNRTLTSEWIEANRDKCSEEEFWVYVSSNRKIPIEFFERHSDKVVWAHAVNNALFPIEFFERHFEKLRNTMYAVRWLATNPNIPAEFFEKRAKCVDWRDVLTHCKLSRDFLECYLEHLDWSDVSGNDSVPIEFLEEHLDKIDWVRLCLGHENVSMGYHTIDESDMHLHEFPIPGSVYYNDPNSHPWPELT